MKNRIQQLQEMMFNYECYNAKDHETKAMFSFITSAAILLRK